jgi:hypothetical protein
MVSGSACPEQSIPDRYVCSIDRVKEPFPMVPLCFFQHTALFLRLQYVLFDIAGPGIWRTGEHLEREALYGFQCVVTDYTGAKYAQAMGPKTSPDCGGSPSA